MFTSKRNIRVSPEPLVPTIHMDSPRPKTPSGFFRHLPKEDLVIEYFNVTEASMFEKTAANYQEMHAKTGRRAPIITNETILIDMRQRLFFSQLTHLRGQVEYSPVSIDELAKHDSPTGRF